ncbi:MAG: YezD family protein [Negativicutes bacterium]|nr:YezD family protein [Negativicutes bacterium]
MSAAENGYWQLSTSNISEKVLNRIEDAVATTSFGSIVLTVQDARLIQIDLGEKIRLDGTPRLLPKATRDRNPVLRSRVIRALFGLKFGQVILMVENGKAVQIERNEKTRWNRMEGQHGDGI